MKPARGFVQIIIVAIIALTFGAAAIFGYQKFLKKSPAIDQKMEAQASPLASADETVYTDKGSANWKTYTDEKNKVSFKYPPGWKVDSNNPLRLIKDDAVSGSGTILIEFNTQLDSSTLNFYKTNASKTEEITLDNIKTIKYTGTEGIGGTVNYIAIIPQGNVSAFRISFSTQDAKHLNPLTVEFNRIVSTFKFLTSLAVIINDGTPKETIDSIIDEIKKIDGVATTRIITQEEALTIYRERYKNLPDLTQNVTTEFFPTSIEVFLEDSAIIQVKELVAKKSYIKQVF